MNPTTLLRTLKGPPIAVLFALLLHPGAALGATRIARITGYTDKPVSQALQLLADLQLAQNHGRYHGWLATAYVRQLILGEYALPEVGESETFRLPPSSSSSIEDDPFRPGTHSTTTTTPALESEYLRLAKLLIDRCATPTAPAHAAATACQAREDDADYSEWVILRWLSYCNSDDGAGINNPGAFIASRLQQNIICPDWHRPETWSDIDCEIQELALKLWPEQ